MSVGVRSSPITKEKSRPSLQFTRGRKFDRNTESNAFILCGIISHVLFIDEVQIEINILDFQRNQVP